MADPGVVESLRAENAHMRMTLARLDFELACTHSKNDELSGFSKHLDTKYHSAKSELSHVLWDYVVYHGAEFAPLRPGSTFSITMPHSHDSDAPPTTTTVSVDNVKHEGPRHVDEIVFEESISKGRNTEVRLSPRTR